MNIAELGSMYLEQSISGGSDSVLFSQRDTSSFDKLMQSKLLDTEKGSQATSRIEKASGTIDKENPLYKQCQALETFVIKTLLESMRKTVMKSGLMDSGFAGKMYEDMLYDEYAENLSSNAGFGLADQAYLELSGARGKTINLTL